MPAAAVRKALVFVGRAAQIVGSGHGEGIEGHEPFAGPRLYAPWPALPAAALPPGATAFALVMPVIMQLAVKRVSPSMTGGPAAVVTPEGDGVRALLGARHRICLMHVDAGGRHGDGGRRRDRAAIDHELVANARAARGRRRHPVQRRAQVDVPRAYGGRRRRGHDQGHAGHLDGRRSMQPRSQQHDGKHRQAQSDTSNPSNPVAARSFERACHSSQQRCAPDE